MTRMEHFIKTLFACYALTTISFYYIIPHINCTRTKRTLAFTSGSSFGYLAAVAVPLDLPNRNIYVAFNLETNYGLPPNDTHYALIEKWNLGGMFTNIDNNVTRIEGKRKRRAMHSRRKFYHCVWGYFELFGWNGTACLLRSICEVAESNLYATSGVVGSIFHVLFTPSSSADEQLPSLMYEAEEHGHLNKCAIYEEACPEGFLDKLTISL